MVEILYHLNNPGCGRRSRAFHSALVREVWKPRLRYPDFLRRYEIFVFTSHVGVLAPRDTEKLSSHHYGIGSGNVTRGGGG